MRTTLFRLCLLIGGVIIGAAFFAEAIGLDNDPGWGRGRIAILILGIVIIASGIFIYSYTDTAFSIFHKIQSLLFQSLARLLKLFQHYWYTFPILVFVILVYIWFASSDSWSDWHSATYHYANLAIGFKEGHLYLPLEPNPEVLSLSNPYDPVARQGVSFPVDYSLYNGKYYLYWGPVPALILVAISPFTHGRVGDLNLVFSFICGIFLLQFLFITTIWDRFFRDLPKWLLLISILVLGLSSPWTYMLINEPNGRIYEAAISGAQFFFMGGLLTTIIVFKKPIPSSFALLFTSFLWALAIGTRLVLVVPVSFMMLMIAYRIWKTTRSSLTTLAMKLVSLSFPVILCLVCLGWYNWSRFGSVTETGFSYALAGTNLNIHNDLFSPIYITPNLYTYLLQPPASMAQFPFLYPKESSPVIGLMFIAPFTVFAILSTVNLLMNATRNASSKSLEKDNSNGLLNWIIANLLGTFSSAFFVILTFFWIATRYVADFMPALAILSMVGFWQGYRLLRQRPLMQRMYSMLGIVLITASITINILLSISVKYIGRTGL
jgi:hypothetical protein